MSKLISATVEKEAKKRAYDVANNDLTTVDMKEGESDSEYSEELVEEEGYAEDADLGIVDDAYIDVIDEEGEYIDSDFIEDEYIDSGYIEGDYIDPGYIDDGYIDPGYMEGGYMDPGMETGMGEIKDPFLSSWTNVIGISAAVLVVSIALGALLAKLKIKKGIDLYED